MNFRTELKCEIDIEFIDPEKSEAYFIGSDWENVFYSFHDLQGLAEHLLFDFHHEGDSYNTTHCAMVRSIEGFGIYVKQKDKSYQLTDEVAEEIGQIIIRYEQELDVELTFPI
jgi:hypothetical protein